MEGTLGLLGSSVCEELEAKKDKKIKLKGKEAMPDGQQCFHIYFVYSAL